MEGIGHRSRARQWIAAALFVATLTIGKQEARAITGVEAAGAVAASFTVYKSLATMDDPTLRQAVDTIVNAIYAARNDTLIGQTIGLIEFFSDCAANGGPSAIDLSNMLLEADELKGQFERIMTLPSEPPASAANVALAYNLLMPILAKVEELRGYSRETIDNVFHDQLQTNYDFAGARQVYIFELLKWDNTVRGHKLWKAEWEKVPVAMRSMFPDLAAWVADSYFEADPITAGVRQALVELRETGFNLATESIVHVVFPCIAGICPADQWVESGIERLIYISQE